MPPKGASQNWLTDHLPTCGFRPPSHFECLALFAPPYRRHAHLDRTAKTLQTPGSECPPSGNSLVNKASLYLVLACFIDQSRRGRVLARQLYSSGLLGPLLRRTLNSFPLAYCCSFIGFILFLEMGARITCSLQDPTLNYFQTRWFVGSLSPVNRMGALLLLP